jgi:hypothetical protein
MLRRFVYGWLRRDGLILRLHEFASRGIHHEVEAARRTAVMDAEARPRFTPAVLNDGATSGTTPRHVRRLEVTVRLSHFLGLSHCRTDWRGNCASGDRSRWKWRVRSRNSPREPSLKLSNSRAVMFRSFRLGPNNCGSPVAKRLGREPAHRSPRRPAPAQRPGWHRVVGGSGRNPWWRWLENVRGHQQGMHKPRTGGCSPGGENKSEGSFRRFSTTI